MGLFRTELRDLSDERLMERIVAGDERAFGALYDRYQRKLLAYFRRMLWNDRERAQDFLQELFTKIAQRPGSYDPARPFSTWLYSVANNMCKNEYRREETRRAAVPHLRAGFEHVDGVHGDGVDRERFCVRLDEELDRLEPDHRATFVMRYHQDMAIKEIAQVFGISEGTVKSRLFYTVKKLAGRLGEFDTRNMGVTAAPAQRRNDDGTA
jgi:RNA polymerase sigma-70 factor (ECF subfamily)